jgi:carboxyl-terminal processing protease
MNLLKLTGLTALIFVTGFASISAEAQTRQTKTYSANLSALTQQTKASYEEIFRVVWQTINDKFYDPDFAGVDWYAVRQRYQPLLPKVKNDRDFYDLISKMLKEIPVSHLGFGMPARQNEVGIGAQTHLIGGQRIITAIATASDAQRKGLRVGDIFLSSPQQVRGPIGTTATLRVKGCDARERTVEVRRESAWWPPERPSLRWRTIEYKPGEQIGYLRALRFDDDVAPQADIAMYDLKDTVGLIIDVRDNSGGNISYIRLSSYFNSGQHLVVALLTRRYLERFRRAPVQINPGAVPKAVGVYTTAGVLEAMKTNGGAVALYSEDLSDKVYRGRVVVLINEGTGSAAEGFAWYMKEKTKATLIGRTTAGALLGAEYFTMPGGWRLGVPTHAGWGPDGKAGIDKAVIPHITAQWTPHDICQGRDPDIAKALDVLTSDR